MYHSLLYVYRDILHTTKEKWWIIKIIWLLGENFIVSLEIHNLWKRCLELKFWGLVCFLCGDLRTCNGDFSCREILALMCGAPAVGQGPCQVCTGSMPPPDLIPARVDVIIPVLQVREQRLGPHHMIFWRSHSWIWTQWGVVAKPVLSRFASPAFSVWSDFRILKLLRWGNF